MNEFLTDEEFAEMWGVDINALVHNRLTDLADQVQHLYQEGYTSLAELLHEEGLQLAKTADSGEPFLYVKDLTASS
jgi:hypothetical protein